MLRADPPNSHNQKIYEQGNGTKVAAGVLLLKNFRGMGSEAGRQYRGITFRCRAKWHWIAVVIIRADQMMFP